MTSDEIEGLIRRLHEDRRQNDGKVIGALFTDDAVFGVAGCEDSSSIACSFQGAGQYQPVLDRLAGLFHWVNVDFHAIIVEGAQAAVNYTLTFDYAPTGARYTSKVTDIMTFRDGRICGMVQYADTAFLNALEQQAAG